MAAITGRTRLCCVLGDPVEHSRSPAMHNAAYAALGLDRRYVALRVTREGLADGVRGLAALGFDGANVTIPHKPAAAGLCDVLSPEAEAAGAVNTLIFGDGRIAGHLTDGTALVDALRAAAPATLGRPALVVGAGGTARAAAFALLAAGVPELQLLARRREAAEALAADLRPLGRVRVVEASDGAGGGALVHCTPVGGLQDLENLPVAADDVSTMGIVADYAYRADGSDTPLVRTARAASVAVADGLELLARQGALAFRLMCGREAPLDVMLAAARGAST
jgi:shikimate dehydrogenase